MTATFWRVADMCRCMHPDRQDPLTVNDLQLDRLLRQSAPVPSPEAVETSLLFSRQVRGVAAGAEPLRARRRPNWVAAGAIAGALSLTGAGTLTAYQLSIPPFQTLEPGLERAMTGIPVNYRSSAGQDVECLAFIEFRNLNAVQREQIEQVASDDRWDGYGQRVLDALVMSDASPEDQQLAIGEVVGEDLYLAAKSAVPPIVHAETGATEGPIFSGSSLSCDIVEDRG